MKDIFLFVLALVLVWLVWHLVIGLVLAGLHIVFQVALIGLFCAVVFWVFKTVFGGDKNRI